MLDQIAAAFDRQDYRTAAQLLKQLRQQVPESPWVLLFTARLQEVSGKTEAAEALYRQLLQQAISSKVAAQAREGLHRLTSIAQAQRQQAIAAATANSADVGVGFLVLEPVPAECRQVAAQRFGQIMNLDAYTARLSSLTRGWTVCILGFAGGNSGNSRLSSPLLSDDRSASDDHLPK
jgi:thioredoxin-like negative regulator of GroEL